MTYPRSQAGVTPNQTRIPHLASPGAPSPAARTETATFPGKVDYLGGQEQAWAGDGGNPGRQAHRAKSAGQCPQGHELGQARLGSALHHYL